MEISFLILVLIQLFILFNYRDLSYKYRIINPLQLLLGIYFLYYYLGVNMFFQGKYLRGSADYSSFIDTSYLCITIMLVSFFIGHQLYLKKEKKDFLYLINSQEKKFKPLILSNKLSLFLAIYILSIYGFFLYSYFFSEHNSFFYLYRNIFRSALDSIVVLLFFFFVANLRIFFIFLSIIYILISIYLGFRYRLIYYFITLACMVVIFHKGKFKELFLKFFVIVSFSIVFVSLIGIIRHYNQNPNFLMLSKVSNVTTFFNSGLFNDTSTMLHLGALVEYIDNTKSYAGFSQVKYLINYFIPSHLYPNKEYSPILDYILLSAPNSEEIKTWGSAVPLVGEFFHTGGYLAVIFISFFLGFILNKLCFNILVDYSKNLSPMIILYPAIISWFLNSSTRGYFPQNIHDLLIVCFGILSIKFFWYLQCKLKLNTDDN